METTLSGRLVAPAWARSPFAPALGAVLGYDTDVDVRRARLGASHGTAGDPELLTEGKTKGDRLDATAASSHRSRTLLPRRIEGEARGAEDAGIVAQLGQQ